MGVKLKSSMKIEKEDNLGNHIEIYVIQEKGLNNKLCYETNNGALGFEDLEIGENIGEPGQCEWPYRITTFEYPYEMSPAWVELENPKKRKVKVDFENKEAYGSFEDIKFVLENLPITDYDPWDN